MYPEKLYEVSVSWGEYAYMIEADAQRQVEELTRIEGWADFTLDDCEVFELIDENGTYRITDGSAYCFSATQNDDGTYTLV